MAVKEDFSRLITVYETDIILPEPPKKRSQIANNRLAVSKQIFRRTEIPDSVKELEKHSLFEVNKLLNDNPEEYEEELKFINQEFDRIEEGYWFYCGGKLTYITGHHYYYLNYYRIDIGYPHYRDRDRRFFLIWDFAEKDPDTYGLLYIKPRREGGTYKAGSINLNTVTSHSDYHGGIQSKTGDDAKSVFKKCIVMPFRRLPFYLKPIYSGTTAPKTSLDFFEPEQKISRKNKVRVTHEALNSWIDWKPSSEESYDGEKLHFAHEDEFGKTKDVNILRRWEVKRECLTLGHTIVGKALFTSTIEEMSKDNLEQCIEIWKDSDHRQRNANGRTTSGLIRYFCSAIDGAEGFVDKFGNSIIEPDNEFAKNDMQRMGSKQYYMNIRADLDKKRDTRALADQKRKYPFTVEEALVPSGDDCLFDVEKLGQQLERLSWEENPFNIKVGDFEWVDGKKFTEVYFKLKQNGKFQVTYYPEKSLQNNVYDYSNYAPRNKLKFVAGADPFDHKQVSVHTRKSKGAGYVFRKYDPTVDDYNSVEDWESHQFVCQYIERPASPDIYYEDMLKMCWFYGCQMLPETQKPGLMKYFERMGCGDFLMNKPKSVATAGTKKSYKGIASSPLTKQALAEYTEEYIYKYSILVPFIELINDWLKFEIENTEKYDASMAAGWTLLATNMPGEAKKETKLKQIPFVKLYKNTGMASQRL
jgi:hypothetical protein